MKPLALTMDKLQGEQQCYIGHIISTIFKLNMMRDQSLLPLTKVLMNGLKTRFMNIMSSDDYNIATMLVLQFKLNTWSKVKGLLKEHFLWKLLRNGSF